MRIFNSLDTISFDFIPNLVKLMHFSDFLGLKQSKKWCIFKKACKVFIEYFSNIVLGQSSYLTTFYHKIHIFSQIWLSKIKKKVLDLALSKVRKIDQCPVADSSSMFKVRFIGQYPISGSLDNFLGQIVCKCPWPGYRRLGYEPYQKQ